MYIKTTTQKALCLYKYKPFIYIFTAIITFNANIYPVFSVLLQSFT